ncbi:G-protein coupled receptors family 1 profile domain-containing protein [Caenorhabditis elegans]|uniref:G-protein coupled receptors family 1 profile domain-containing protein n=1 Tax=Caenorhabditis elegans TaxID=6239 RepID=Q7JLI6_CAEEL|nr:G-protein coupled receptors family 1 profile domain-containing protein [Caenorhabditis elegans]CAF31474.1 G-protein coupled receptors family 1 profile domain-containing protein [Caenorhabditis elegans]|eukprot:NP_001023897.1 Serpentine Receptor, class X [Caenorhabditis elegans]
MSNSTALDYQDSLNLTVGCLLLVIGTFGIVCNSLILYIFFNEKTERTSFNLICVLRSFSNIYILLTTFIGIFFPKTILGYLPIPPFLESTIIHISLTLYLGNEYQIILVAINRFIALFFPRYYNMICGIKTTLGLLTSIYTFRIIVVIFETIDKFEKQCNTFFSLEMLAFKYDEKHKCQFKDNILTVVTITFLMMTIINGTTLIKIITFYRSNQSETLESKSRIRRNVLLFLQTGLQDSLYLIDLLFMMKLSQLSDTRVWSFISGTFVWQCLHSIDGFIMIMFNERLTLLKKKLFQSTLSTHHVTHKLTVSVVQSMPDVGS